jgi:hypothetical protein
VVQVPPGPFSCDVRETLLSREQTSPPRSGENGREERSGYERTPSASERLRPRTAARARPGVVRLPPRLVDRNGPSIGSVTTPGRAVSTSTLSAPTDSSEVTTVGSRRRQVTDRNPRIAVEPCAQGSSEGATRRLETESSRVGRHTRSRSLVERSVPYLFSPYTKCTNVEVI